MVKMRTIMSLGVIAMLLKLAVAANYTVGSPNGGWDTTTDVQSWATSQSFLVGDNLIFQYGPNHNVYEVSKGDYDTCQTSNPIQTQSGGSTVIPLSSPGKRYFICGTPGHCTQGMKLEIDILATAPPPASPTNSPLPSSPLTPPVSSPSPSPKSSGFPSPAHSPELAPTLSPSSPFPPESPSELPEFSPTSSPLPGVSLAAPPSSANKDTIPTNLIISFSLIMMMMMKLLGL
ncbi:uclacyanin 1 [Manihot esculenta]|uniref:Uncharacterized protein n=3 Tax=Manihot esculenta TaxID=3983 RepID=A0ACB7GL75_MANES|nr:uclacyanin 1 [Manihot esculenta]KAG8640673.1 hypothetical protein MANES_13G074200v8 [Manihot esculenta]KAG8640674.1 hypothetical protein MANES_13G074200v8 [Manihot esculenta]KAG8640675.1 hypothetical protein MANES_13G074200v8 [Manihot esculenta]